MLSYCLSLMLCSILVKSTEITIYKHNIGIMTSCIICPASSNHIPATSSEPLVRSAGSVFWASLTHQSLVIWVVVVIMPGWHFFLILWIHFRLQLPQGHAKFGFWKHSLKAWKLFGTSWVVCLIDPSLHSVMDPAFHMPVLCKPVRFWSEVCGVMQWCSSRWRWGISFRPRICVRHKAS